MKILTLNTHSYQEENQIEKLNILTDAIIRNKPDIIGLQEINQKNDAPEIIDNELITAQFGIPMRKDNYSYILTESLYKQGIKYNLVWLGIKKGFEIYDEGLAFLSKYTISAFDTIQLSKTEENKNWKKRMALGIKAENQWFYNSHFGRWDDIEEPFYYQWDNFLKKHKKCSQNWVLGDFNSPSEKSDEGYDLILSSVWYDSYLLAEKRDEGSTVIGKIDGWKDKSFKNERIDYIFTDKKISIKESKVIFNNKNEKQISDHFGIILTV